MADKNLSNAFKLLGLLLPRIERIVATWQEEDPDLDLSALTDDEIDELIPIPDMPDEIRARVRSRLAEARGE